MGHVSHLASSLWPEISPLVLSDRLIRLAQDADTAGFPVAAEHLLYLADEVLERPSSLRG